MGYGMEHLRRVNPEEALNHNTPLVDFTGNGQRNVASRSIDIEYPGGIPTLQCPNLASIRDISYAAKLDAMAKQGKLFEGQTLVQRLFQVDLPDVVEKIVRGKHTPINQRPPRLGGFLRHLGQSTIFSDLNDAQLLEIMYREEAGLRTLQERGIRIVPTRQSNQSTEIITIPLDDASYLTRIDITPVEVYAVMRMLQQTRIENLAVLGFNLSSDPAKDIHKALSATESAKGQLRQDGAFKDLYAKLLVIAAKGHMAPLVKKTPSIDLLIDMFEGIPPDLVRKILQRGLEI